MTTEWVPNYLRPEGRKKEFVDYVLLELDRSPNTVLAYLNGLRRLETAFGQPIEEITSDDVRAFIREPGPSQKTKQLTVCSIRMFHQWGALEGYWSLNGIMSVRSPRTDPHPKMGLTREQAWTLLESCVEPQMFRLIYLGLYAGTRMAESGAMSAAEWEDPERLVFTGKGRKQREVPVHPELLDVRDIILDMAPPADNNRQLTLVATMCKRVGFKFTSHQLRKTFAQTLYDADVPFEVVGELLGHARSVTGLYARVSSRKMRSAVEKLTYR